MLGEMCRSYESAFSLADAWMFVQVSGFGDTHFEDALNAVRDITPEDIRELAGKHLCKEKLKEVISGKKCHKKREPPRGFGRLIVSLSKP